MHTIYIEALGWIAAAFTLSAHSMKTMLPLRIAACCASVFFISFSALAHVWPTMALHMILLPLNVYRLIELLRLTRQVEAARGADFDLRWISSLVRARHLQPGEVIFAKGDRADFLYYLEKGQIALDEIETTIDAGQIFGEIAFFTSEKERTLTARCATPCTIYAINEATFMRLFYQNPAFGFFIVQLVGDRLLDGLRKRPDAYVPVAKTPEPV